MIIYVKKVNAKNEKIDPKKIINFLNARSNSKALLPETVDYYCFEVAPENSNNYLKTLQMFGYIAWVGQETKIGEVKLIQNDFQISLENLPEIFFFNDKQLVETFVNFIDTDVKMLSYYPNRKIRSALICVCSNLMLKVFTEKVEELSSYFYSDETILKIIQLAKKPEFSQQLLLLKNEVKKSKLNSLLSPTTLEPKFFTKPKDCIELVYMARLDRSETLKSIVVNLKQHLSEQKLEDFFCIDEIYPPAKTPRFSIPITLSVSREHALKALMYAMPPGSILNTSDQTEMDLVSSIRCSEKVVETEETQQLEQITSQEL